ncbi:unnamed protein product [Pylaiella littoralis]
MMLRANRGGGNTRGSGPTSPMVWALVGGSLAVSLAFNVVNAKARRGVSSSGGSASGPRAVKRPHRVPFGKVGEENRGKNPMDPPLQRVDEYFWMRDDKRESKEVLGHIKKENDYTEEKMAHLKDLREDLYKEFLGHMKETDAQVPYRHGPYFYYSRSVKGKPYKIHCRSKEVRGQEQVVLDENVQAEGSDYCDIADVSPSPGAHDLAAYAADMTGYETYDVRFRDVATGKDLDDAIVKTSGDVCWGADATTMFYTTQDEEHRPHKLWLHTLGTPQAEDVLLYTEDDQLMWMGIGKTDSDRFLTMRVGSKTTSEIRFIDLQGVQGAEAHRVLSLKTIADRVEGVRYGAEHWGEDFYMVTNKDGCKNSKLVKAPISSPGAENWTDVIPYDPAVCLKGVLCFENHLVLSGRENGLSQLWIRDMRTEETHQLAHPETAYASYATSNMVFETGTLRFGYQSMVSPRSVYDYDMDTKSRTLMKEQEVPGYDRSVYTCERTVAKVRDGVEVPMSLVYRKDTYPDGLAGTKAPCMLYGYGSYGASIEPSFDFTRLSFLDRGMVYAIAHIRGGGEMGRPWYEDSGKYLTKRNTFQDFVDCAEHLVAEGVTSPKGLAVCGRSAGGLLIGNVVNMRPDLFAAAVADVPFVDLMNSMADPSIPLTITEWEEWGNPNEFKYHDYMLSYSPYDNVRPQPYPAMLVTGGLNDPRVAYWEPCKWVSKLRDMATTDNPLYLKIDMSAGHFSASDRYKHMKEQAFEYAFVLDVLGCMSLVPTAATAAKTAAEVAGGGDGATTAPRASL